MSNSILRVQFEELSAGKTKNEVIRFFESADTYRGITDVDLSTDGVAIVTFANADDADRLLRNPPVFDGVQLKARRCVPKKLNASTSVFNPMKLPLPAKGPAIPHRAKSCRVVEGVDEKKGGVVVRRHSENLRTKPKPRIPSRNHTPSNQAIGVSDSDNTGSSRVETSRVLHPQRNLDDVDENGNNARLCSKADKLVTDSSSLREDCPMEKPKVKSEFALSLSSSLSSPAAASASISSVLNTLFAKNVQQMQLQQQDTGHTDANAVKVFINENTSLQQVEPIITESDNCKAFETTSTETCITESELPSEQQQDIHVGHTDATAFKVFIITESDNCKSFETTSTETCIRELKLPSEQQHYIGHTDATAVKVIINENTSLQQVEPIITESDNCKTFETTSTETCITESEFPLEQQQDIGHTNATAVKVNENTSLQQVEPIITEPDNCKAFETTSTETCITELKLPSEQQHYIRHTYATAVKVFTNENTSIQRVEPIITESDKCKELETASTETCISESELPSEQQQDIGHTDATAFKVFTNENTSLQQVEPIITESDNCKAFEKTSTETCITELKLPSERIKLIKVLMNADVLNLADYDCQVTCDEQTGKIILTGHRRNEVEILVRKKLDTMVSAVVPVANRFLQTTKGVNWLTAEFRKHDLLSVCYIKDKASVVVAKDEECLRETITVMSNILYSETVLFGNDCLQKSDLDKFMMALNDDYMVLAETDFDMRKITIEGSATDVKLIVKSIVTESIEDSECSRNVPLSEIAGALLNKFQSEIRNLVDKEVSLQQNVKLVFNPISLEIVGSNRDAEAAEKIITEQYIKTIQGHILNVDDIGGNIEDFCRKDSYEAFILQQLEEKYRCVIRVEDSAKLDIKAEETLRPASNITVVKGDITQFTDADVLVNQIEAETSDLTNASLMFTKAGRQALQQGFDKVCAPIWIGSDVTVTGPAGTIHSKKIFHAAIRRYRNKKSIEVSHTITIAKLS